MAEISQKRTMLHELKVRYVLNMAKELPNAFPEEFNYMKLELSDEKDTDIISCFHATNEFIGNLLGMTAPSQSEKGRCLSAGALCSRRESKCERSFGLSCCA